MRYIVRFQESGALLPAKTLAAAKGWVRCIYPLVRFVDERSDANGIACEFDGNLVARIEAAKEKSGD